MISPVWNSHKCRRKSLVRKLTEEQRRNQHYGMRLSDKCQFNKAKWGGNWAAYKSSTWSNFCGMVESSSEASRLLLILSSTCDCVPWPEESSFSYGDCILRTSEVCTLRFLELHFDSSRFSLTVFHSCSGTTKVLPSMPLTGRSSCRWLTRLLRWYHPTYRERMELEPLTITIPWRWWWKHNSRVVVKSSLEWIKLMLYMTFQ